MKKGGFKLGLNELMDLFKPGQSHSHGLLEQADEDVEVTTRPVNVMRKREPAPVKRQESEVYGRRW